MLRAVQFTVYVRLRYYDAPATAVDAHLCIGTRAFNFAVSATPGNPRVSPEPPGSSGRRRPVYRGELAA